MKKKPLTSDKKRSSRKNATKSEEHLLELDRRSFVKMIPALGVTGLAPSRAAASPAAEQQQQPQAPQRVTKDMVRAAQQLIGIELTDANIDMALAGINTNLTNYENIRKVDVPLDTEPAISFHPSKPRKRIAARVGRIKASRIDLPKYDSVEDLAFSTLTELAELVRTKKVSSVDLTKMYLGRLKRYGKSLLNVVTLTEELALQQAEAADREIRRGKYRGPLHGIPCGVKDLFATKGFPTTWGAEPFRNQMIDYDSTVVEKLREAGAVLAAKLSMGALAQGGRWFAGVTRNPWQPEEDRTGSSGSSAGSASATSAGLVGFSIGTETLGSIISPSSRCGVVGLRPTYGRVSRYGAMGLSWTMDKIGPICRGVEDCALVLDAIYGPDGHDITVENIPFNWMPDRPLSQMKIGYIKTEFDQGNDERKKMYAEALDALRSAGAKLEPIEMPKFPTQSLRIILVAEAAAAFDDITRDGKINQLSGQMPSDWPNTFRTSRFIPAVEYLRAQRARTLLVREMDKLMADWDVFVSPAPGSASLFITNLTGHPAVTVPCGFTGGLPQAIMFTGGLYEEGAPLRVALAYERATKWHTMHPKGF
jgi:Asp-tRNA(Asn)/Glu-tRNA(Gln) amidotransferase A subunit family amidase